MRDKFLTEAMGGCVFSPRDDDYIHCEKCGCDIMSGIHDNDFSSWRMFGTLWEWFQTHPMFMFFIDNHGGFIDFDDGTVVALNVDYILSPDKFADAVYEFLKEQPCMTTIEPIE